MKITRIGLGAWPIGGIMYGDIDNNQGIEVVKRYLERGGNFIDTARAYRKSERLVAQAIQQSGISREDLIIATKTKADTPEEIRKDLETSLQELATDYVDLLYLHVPPEDEEAINLALDTLEALKAEGKIRASGASIKGPNVTPKTQELCRRYIDTGKVNALQVIFSLFRQENRDIFKYAHEKGVGIIARTCLESGFLTGKYQPGSTFPEGDHRNRWTSVQRDEIFSLVQSAQEAGFDPPYQSIVEIAARYAIDEAGVSSVILGATRPDQVDRNCDLDALPPINFTFRNRLTEQFSGKADLLNISE